MTHVALYAQWTGYAVWVALAWAALSKAATITDRVISERRRRRNARRLTFWRPQPPQRDPGSDVTRVLPGIQRPRGPIGR